MTADLDPDKQSKAKILAAIRRRLMLIDLSLGLVYLSIWLFSGASQGLRDLILLRTNNPWLEAAVFSAIFAGIYVLLNLPLAYYSEFYLPHRFDLSTQTLEGWISDLLKSMALSAVFGFLLVELIYWLLRIAPDTWWIWTAVALLFFTVLLANLSPILIAPLFFKFVLLGEEHSELTDRLLRLAQQAGTRINGVYKMDMSRRTRAANAALMGLGATRRIVLGDTLLNSFSSDEIETVLAHELAHQVHRDIPLSILFQTATTLAGLYLASLGMKWGSNFFGLNGLSDIAGLPVFLLVIGLFGLITMPLTNTFSRWRESKADRYALAVTRKPAAFASAMRRLADQNLADADPAAWEEYLLYSHPALSKRIALASAFQKKEEENNEKN